MNETSPPWYERIRYPLHYSEYVRVHAREHRLDPALVAAVIYQESKFRQRREVVVGRDRADAAHARDRAGDRDPHAAAPRSTRATSTTRRSTSATAPGTSTNLFQKYGSEDLVLAAYNAGQGNVDRWRARGQAIQFPETRAYVKRVEHLKSVYRDAWGKDLGYR